ncbi:MAG: hypothetical protein ACP5E5_13445 [Acidobacteriaceae bacterium]
MSSAPINTIFTTPPPSSTRPGSFMVSVLVHGLVVIAALTLIHTPRVEQSPLVRRYTTLTVDLQTDHPIVQWPPQNRAAKPTPQAETHATPASEQLAAALAAPAVPPSHAYRTPAPVTLIQPDVTPDTLLQVKTPLPKVVMWTRPTTPAVKIVPPPPQPQPAANVRPSLSMPNHEVPVVDIELASTPVASQTIPLLAGTTTPIPQPGLDPSHVPQSSSTSSAQPTPKAILSVSDVVLTQGIATLPPVNQVAAATRTDFLAPGQPKSASVAGVGSIAGKQGASGSRVVPGDHGSQTQAATGPGAESGTKANPSSGSSAGSIPGSSPGDGLSVARITRPMDGHFGVIVVGDSVADEYPEAADIWADRLAYTVYLHVGDAKSWIMQYCLPRAAQASGSNTRPDAPWPYLIVTPHLAPGDSDTDALLVHGFINADGHFEHLAVVFPEQFAQSGFVLGALQQWQFRPAAQNGQSTTVEVLLIIPEEDD